MKFNYRQIEFKRQAYRTNDLLEQARIHLLNPRSVDFVHKFRSMLLEAY